MELVYLWVEGYKNIEKQGFNFSPRFECKYNEDENELTIKENDDYIPDFFGENINVTAIVGKNGSGKSSVLEVFSQIYNQIFFKLYKKSFFYVLRDNSKNDFIYYSSGIEVEVKETDKIRKTENYFLSKNHFQMGYLNISHLERDRIVEDDAYRDSYIQYLGVYNKDTHLDANTIHPQFSEFNLSKFNFLQTEKIISLLRDSSYQNIILRDLKIREPYFIKVIYDSKKVSDYWDLLKKDGLTLTEIDELKKLLDTLKENILQINTDTYNNFFKLVNKIYIDIPFRLEFLDKEYNSIKFSGGENTILFYLERIAYFIENTNNQNIIFLFDEIELYLHPYWQKIILKIILDIITLSDYEKFHLIISSHSPFILSDIPKQSIIFLDKDKNGNCKVVDGLKEKKQTFGANIHTLLSDSFFMEDGLMGEFAKSKINEIIDFHKTVQKKRHINCLKKIYLAKRKDKFWQTQSIIGEEYLKQVIKNHLVEIEKVLLGKDGAKKEEIVRVEAYLESLKK